MKILGIETSCDETAIAVLEAKANRFFILSNIVSSQIKLHAKYGGVYPALAKREHEKNLPSVLEKSLKKARNPRIDLIAVTSGPGLEPCLWSGINFAKELAKKLKVPLIPVSHIEGHILVNFIDKKSFFDSKVFPAIALIASGGHTELYLIKKIGNYKLLGQTRDDAAGECFDKTARILGMPYPGGPAINKEASKINKKAIKIQEELRKVILPRPMIYQKNYDFSFSGLKTAVLYNYQKQTPQKQKSKIYKQIMSFHIQQAIIDILIHKTIRATKEYKAKTIIIGGGVAANNELRKQLKLKIKGLKHKVNLFLPKKEFCTDNGAMIAITGYYQWIKNNKKINKDIEANANLSL